MPPPRSLAEPGRQRQAQLAARRLLALALVQPQLDLVQLGLAHDPGQAQQKPVVVGARVVETLAVGEDHAEQRAQLEQLMPVAVVAGQPRGVEAEHQAGVAEPDLGEEPLEAVPLVARGARPAEILVDDVDPLARPAEPDGPLDQAVLQLGALLVLAYLLAEDWRT